MRKEAIRRGKYGSLAVGILAIENGIVDGHPKIAVCLNGYQTVDQLRSASLNLGEIANMLDAGIYKTELSKNQDIPDNIEQTGTQQFDALEIPIYRAKDTGTMGNTDTMALLTKLVNELKAENELLKSEIFKKQFESSTSGLGKQMADVEAGKVVPR